MKRGNWGNDRKLEDIKQIDETDEMFFDGFWWINEGSLDLNIRKR